MRRIEELHDADFFPSVAAVVPMRRGDRRRRNFLLLCALGTAIKIVLYFVDSRPALFMGDSASYLATAYVNYIPPDRSFAYGYLLKAIALWPNSLETVVQTQVAWSALSCCVLGWALLRYLRLPLLPAAMLVGICAVEPLQLLSERFVLTEAAATLLLSLMIWTAFAYSESSRIWLLLLDALLGVILVSFRMAYLPFVIASSLLVPLLSPAARTPAITGFRYWRVPERKWMSVALSLVLSVAASQVLLRQYRLLYRALFNPSLRPAYLYQEGYFLLSDFAPIVTPDDYPIAKDRAWVFSHVGIPLGDRRGREQQHWLPNGLCEVIKRVPGQGEYRGNRMARLTALNAIRRDPAGAIRLAVASASDYFDSGYLKEAIAFDQGVNLRLSPAEAVPIRQFFAFVRRPEDDNTVIRRWQRFAWPWYIALIFVPAVYLIALASLRRYTRAIDWYLVVPAALIVFTSTVLVGRPTVRYETALGWLVFLLIGTVLARSCHTKPEKSQ